MLTRVLTARLYSPLPKLAATALVCCALGANTYFDNATNTASALHLPSDSYEVASPYPNSDIPSMHVLSAKDASRYLTIFAAQEQGDWKTADKTIGKLGERALMGHVLADRYMRRPATAAELQAWLDKYSDLPEAAAMYDRAVALAGNDAQIPRPSATAWTGGDSYAGAFGFRGGVLESNAIGRRFEDKFNAELRGNHPLAAENLLTAEQKHLPAATLARAQGLVAAAFFYDGQVAHARHLAAAGAKQQDALSLWVGGLSAFKQNNMREAGDDFALLAAETQLSPWDRSAAQFWAWRALRHTSKAKNARFWLEQAAQNPHSFYGSMAAGIVGNGDGWSWELPVLDKTQVAVLASQKAGFRALALLQIGKRDLAESELRDLNPQGHRDLQGALLALTAAEHMPSLALQLGGVATKANGEPYDAALYPLPPWQPAEGFRVDPALLYALMRHESQFDPLAVSDRGACGLMQLLPATANLLSVDKDGVIATGNCPGRLLDPSFNMALGQKYMLHLANQPLIGDNLLLLLAAYNSGPSKLGRWLHDNDRAHETLHGRAHGRAHIAASFAANDYDKEDPLLFLESMPVRQTHDYVEQVLMHYWSYRARLGEPQTSLIDLANGKWPRLAPPEEKPLPKGTKEAALPAAIVKVASK